MRLFCSAAAIAFSLFASAQTIRRVNNTPGISTPYTTINAAIAAASAGDIILVEGSNVDYTLPANYTLTKRVTIQGPGFLLPQNPGVQADTRSAYISLTGSFILDAGSEGSVISGLVFKNPLEVRVSNIIISHNGMYTLVINNTTPQSNLWFHANYDGVYNTAGAQVIFSSGTTANTLYTNILISNNIFNWRVVMGTMKYGTFTNNSVFCNPTTGAWDLSHFVVTNNIFSSIGSMNLSNALVQNNVFCGSGYYPAFDPVLKNITNAVINDVFEGLILNTYDTQYKLKAGSVAIGAGIDGTDAGIYGGPNPYNIGSVTEGQPNLNSFTSPATIPQNVKLPVKVGAKAN